ncbi:MAG: methyltransferase [Hyphomicrobiaceae bacterium]|nr:MAG: methyltransferase [Hyphomicrobiaceae bacterium]
MIEPGAGAKLVFAGSETDGGAVATAIELLACEADAISEFMAGPGRLVVEAYFAGEEVARMAAQELASALPAGLAEQVRIEAVPDRNWAAEVERGSKALRIGRFILHGPHNRGAARGSHLAIEMEAGLAFGTGRHASTAGCLLAIDEIARRRPVSDVLDVGCGSGVLAIAAAKAMPRARVLASDIDAIAVAVTRANSRLNGVASRVMGLHAAGLDDRRLNRRFDLILANILAGPLCRLAGGMAGRLKPGGTLVLAGLLNDEARGVAATYRAVGFHEWKRMRIEGWTILVMGRR